MWLCDADYVGCTGRRLHHRINEHKYSAIGRHLEKHGLLKTDLVDKQFSVLKKCRSRFDCLIFEMLFIKELNPELNTQRDSIRAKLFYVTLRANTLLFKYIFTLLFVSPRNSFTFIFVLISLIIDLIMTLRKRRNVVAFLNFYPSRFLIF